MDEPGPKRRGRRAPAPEQRQRDAERTRQRILDAGTDEFAANGYAGARVDAIAARAGVNKQLIAYYFGGKAGLYRAIADRWSRGEERLDHGATSLGELVRSYVPASDSARALTRLVAWEGLTAHADDPGGRVRTARMQAALADLRRRQEAGELPAGVDPGCLLLACFAAASAPATLPHVARSIFGPDADSAGFTSRYADQLARIVGSLTEGRRRTDESRAEPRS